MGPDLLIWSVLAILSINTIAVWSAMVFLLRSGTEYKRIRKELNEYFAVIHTDQGDQPSQFAQSCDVIASLFAQRIKESTIASEMAQVSAEKRQATAINREVISGVLGSQNPVLQAGFDRLPIKWRNIIAKNPAILDSLANVIGRSGDNGHSSPNNPGYYTRLKNNE